MIQYQTSERRIERTDSTGKKFQSYFFSKVLLLYDIIRDIYLKVTANTRLGLYRQRA
jgi:hypothetical protein